MTNEHLKILNLKSADLKNNPNLWKIDFDKSYVEEITTKLSETVFGQDEALKSLGRRVALFESGLADPNRPLGVLYFLGPTGTGKTETARALAKYLFKDPYSPQLKIINSPEFSDNHTVSRLIGSPPGYIGYGDETLITENLLGKRNIIVFDEVEKASKQLQKILLSIMEYGSIYARHGTQNNKAKETELKFNLSIIILTSNLGSGLMENMRKKTSRLGFETPYSKILQDKVSFEKIALSELKRYYFDMPEFLGRIDDIVVFNSLKPDHYRQIFWKLLAEKNLFLNQTYEKPPFLTATTELVDFILGKVNEEYGGRDLRHALDKYLFEKVADIFMGADISGRPVIADFENGEVVFYTDIIPISEKHDKKELGKDKNTNKQVKEEPAKEPPGSGKVEPDPKKPNDIRKIPVIILPN